VVGDRCADDATTDDNDTGTVRKGSGGRHVHPGSSISIPTDCQNPSVSQHPPQNGS
jgi:hypothetical protein